jgi:hypothetical protein
MSHLAHPARRRFRRISSAVAVLVAVALSSLTGLIPGLSGAEPADAQAVPAGTPGVIRYFGRGAYDGIRAAVAATPRSCALSDDELTALVMAPVFKEVSMGETPEAAPSPMTLSRWDEWSGRWSGSNNLNANYGLYAFRDPNTPYRRAYWTPGIGIFQYDVAGVGKPYTAAEMMNVQFIAGDVAGGMANRYCAAGGDSYNQRAAAWQPWSGLNGVAKSEALFQEMVGLGHPPFSTIGLVDGIDNAGGMQTHTCLLSGVPTPCDYVNPAAAQGANWWATTDVEGGAVASGEAPLTAPFYVVKRDGHEERHWLAADTGYDVSISARRAIGLNARPMDAEAGSGLGWYAGSDLCDTDRPELGCPLPAAAPAATEQPADAAATDGSAAPADIDAMAWLSEVLVRLAAAQQEAAAAAAADEPAATEQAAAAPDAAADSSDASAFTFARGLAAGPSAPR